MLALVSPAQLGGMVIHGFQRLIGSRYTPGIGLDTSLQAMDSVGSTAALTGIGDISIRPPFTLIPAGVTIHIMVIGTGAIILIAGMGRIVKHITLIAVMLIHPIKITADLITGSLITAASGMVTMAGLNMTGVTTTGARVTASGHILGNRISQWCISQ
ncbi:MAG: hypothetical protein L3J22_02490 [Xanthomonadales bacterium]|nr:hypothetical protein [Xanthomonadales bacterium]